MKNKNKFGIYLRNYKKHLKSGQNFDYVCAISSIRPYDYIYATSSVNL